MSRVVSYTQFRQHLAEEMQAVNENAETLFVSRQNGDGVVVMSAKDYNSLQETLYLLLNPINRERLQQSVKQARKGQLKEIDL